MLTLTDIRHSYDSVEVLRGIDLEVNRGGIFCLLGPSGCGKTTLLRVIAGLEIPDNGQINLKGQDISRISVADRGFGFMFQELALFPHMNVEENIAFGLKMRSVTDTRDRVREVMQLVGLEGFETRDVAQLSGGERQRVALARSLAPNPRLLMLDEPLGSLDAALRDRLVLDLRRIIKEIGLTAIYVTHDQLEAFAIADRIAIMNAGQIEQIDSPETLYRQPRTSFAAAFLGLNNILPVEAYENGHAHTPLGAFSLPERSDSLLLHPIGIRCESEGMTRGRVVERVFQGDTYRLRMEHASGHTLTFNITAQEKTIPGEGDMVSVSVAPDMVVPLANSEV